MKTLSRLLDQPIISLCHVRTQTASMEEHPRTDVHVFVNTCVFEWSRQKHNPNQFWRKIANLIRDVDFV